MSQAEAPAASPDDVGHLWAALEGASCTSYDPELFFPDDPGEAERARTSEIAKAICRRCTVSRPCLDIALALRLDTGIWGAATPAERRAMGPPSCGPSRSRRPSISGTS